MAKTVSKKKGIVMGLSRIDYVVLLLVVICLLGAIIRVGQVNWFAGNSDLDQYEIYFSVTDIADTSKDAFVIGDTVTLCDNAMVLGTLEQISDYPATFYVKDPKGNILSVNYPEDTRIDVKGYLLSHGRMADDGYLLGGTTYVAPGKAYRVQSEHMDFTLNILDIKEK